MSVIDHENSSLAHLHLYEATFGTQLKENVSMIYLFHTSYSNKETPIFGKLASTLSLKCLFQLEALIFRTFVTFQKLKPYVYVLVFFSIETPDDMRLVRLLIFLKLIAPSMITLLVKFIALEALSVKVTFLRSVFPRLVLICFEFTIVSIV